MEAQTPGKARDITLTRDKGQETGLSGGPAIPRSYALVVGIGDYPNLPERGQLQFPQRDAAAMYSTLISPEGGQFPPENVHRLLGKQATLAALRRELEQWLPSVAKDDDRVLIYFAGHGFVSGGKAYLAPYDVDPRRIAETSYAMDQLGRIIGGKIRGKWKVLLTDACHSGAIVPAADASTVQASLAHLDKSLFSLTASRDREQSFESEIWGGGHGAFTYYAMQGIGGEADENRDGVVTADELAEYVRVNVRRETQGKQNPTAERGSFDPQMILGYNPSRAPVKSTLSSKFGALVIESNMDGVEVFVDGKSMGVVDKGKGLRIPGLTPGVHQVKGVRMGYEPDGPREETVYPGQETTVTVRILVARRKNKAAVDAFEEGLELYQKGYAGNYRKAVTYFERALQLDPAYSQAALFLGRTYSALYEWDKAQAALERAVRTDPDYAEASAALGSVLLDRGDADGAIRALNAALTRRPEDAESRALLGAAFLRKSAWEQAGEHAGEAIRLRPGLAEPHLWLAESLRMRKQCKPADEQYARYLQLSDFDSKLAGRLNYYVLGYLAGMGRKKRAAEADIWAELRFLAAFGRCDCARMNKDFGAAERYCQQALRMDQEDLYAHYALAVVYSEQFNAKNSVGSLAAARSHFERVIRLNPEAVEAEKARKYLLNIDQVMTSLSGVSSAGERRGAQARQ